jgi:anti-anti-sigma factor
MDTSDSARHVIIELPDEIDIVNAEAVGAQLRTACKANAIVIADMARTTFCDARGMQELLNAHYRAKELICELRVALPSGFVLRTWELLGVDRIFAIYPTLEAAMAEAEFEMARSSSEPGEKERDQ